MRSACDRRSQPEGTLTGLRGLPLRVPSETFIRSSIRTSPHESRAGQHLGQHDMAGTLSERYDAICFFNSSDRDAVSQIVSSLRSRELRIWFDETDLPPTAPVHDRIDTALKASRV